MSQPIEFEMKPDAVRWPQRCLGLFLLVFLATAVAPPAMAQMQPASAPSASAASAAAHQQLVEVFVREG
jgi:hypothetical protein